MRPLCHADLSPGPEQSFEDAMRCYMVLYRRYYQVTANAPWHIRSVEDRQSVEKMAADRGDAKNSDKDRNARDQGKGKRRGPDVFTCFQSRRASRSLQNTVLFV